SPCSSMSPTSGPPTFPNPRMPTPIVFLASVMASFFLASEKVGFALPAHDDARLTIPYEDHRGPGDAVVVRGHRVPVRAGDRHRENLTEREIRGQLRVTEQQVSLFAVLARDRHRRRPRREHASGHEGLVARAVRDRAQVVAHPAVDGNVGANTGDLLDGAD